MVLRAGQQSSAPSPAPLLSGTQNCSLFTQGSPLSVYIHSQGVSLPNSYLRMGVADKWKEQEM